MLNTNVQLLQKFLTCSEKVEVGKLEYRYEFQTFRTSNLAFEIEILVYETGTSLSFKLAF